MFSPAEFEWNGESFSVPADRVMGLLAVIEDHITHEKLIYIMSSVANASSKAVAGSMDAQVLAEVDIPRVRLSRAMGAALRYAGAKASDEDVYHSLFGADGVITVLSIVDSLLRLSQPPQEMEQKVSPKKKPSPRKKKAASS